MYTRQGLFDILMQKINPNKHPCICVVVYAEFRHTEELQSPIKIPDTRL